MLGGNSSKVDPLVEKTLLSIIEKRGLARDEVVLVDICDSNKEVFGEKSSDVRRALLVQWGNLKRRSIRSYAAYLERFAVPKGAGTLRLLAEGEQVPSDNEEDSDYSGSSTNSKAKKPQLKDSAAAKFVTHSKQKTSSKKRAVLDESNTHWYCRRRRHSSTTLILYVQCNCLLI